MERAVHPRPQAATRPDVRPRLTADRGFSLIELLLVVFAGTVLLGTAVIMTKSGVSSFRASGAMDTVKGQLHVAREQAISRQRTIRLALMTTTQLDLYEVQPNPANPEVKIGSIVMPGNMKFQKLATGSAQPSDAWCQTGPNATLNTITTLRFNSEGSLTDDTGALVSGCLYLGETGVVTSARTISIFGSTGAMRTFKYDGTNWVR